MSTQAVNVDVTRNTLVVEIPPDEILNLEAQVSVVPPDQIAMLEKIRQDSIDARDLSEKYSIDSHNSANEAADSEIFSRQYRDESKELNEDTRDLYKSTDNLHTDTVNRHENIVERHDAVNVLHENTELLEQSSREYADRAESARNRSIVAETRSSDSEAESLASQTASKESENKAKTSEAASAESAIESAGSASDSANSAYNAETSNQSSKARADDSACYAVESKQSQLAAQSSETNSKAHEISADESRQAAAGSEQNALASEKKSDEHRQSSADSDSSARAAKEITVDARDTTLEAKEETIIARDLARRWATEDEDTPIADNEFSALHWAKVSERFAGTLTNGMYFVGSWDLADGYPPDPPGTQVPWYRIKGTDTSAIRPENSSLDDLASKSNKGDQLIWDPIKKEWFVIDTSDEVWLVNGKKGNVVLNADDVGALSLKDGGEVKGPVTVAGLTDRQYRIQHSSAEYSGEFVVTTNGVFIRKRNADGSHPRSIGIQPDGNAAVYDGSWRKIYHENNKPTLAEINAAPSGYGLGQESLDRIDNVDDLNTSETGWFRAITGTPGNPTDGSGYAIQNIAYNSSSDNFIQIGFSQSSTTNLYIRTHNAAGWTGWNQLYTTQFKPNASDVGLGNVTNNKQVVAVGNNRIQSASSFIIDGNATAGHEDNVCGVLRITLSENTDFGAKGTVFFQAGHAQSVDTSNNGAMVFGGYWGGFLQEANFKLLDAKKLTVQVSGSSTRHTVYHTANKPTPAEIGALSTTGNQELSGAINPQVSEGNADDLPSSWSTGYSLSQATGSAGYAAWGTLITSRASSGRTSQIVCYPDTGIPKIRFRVSDPDDGSWLSWADIYSTQRKPTPAEIGAVSITGNQTLNGTSSFIINGPADYGRFRLDNTNTVSGDDKGMVYLQAGFDDETTGASRGTLRLTGWYGGNLKECSIFAESANSVKVRYNGTYHPVYHAGNKPTPAEIGALSSSGGEASGNIVIRSGNNPYYSIISTDSDSNSNPEFRISNISGQLRFMRSGSSRMILRAGNTLDDPWRLILFDGAGMNSQVYHEHFKPTADDVKAIPNTTERLASSVNPNDLYKENGVYEVTQNNFDDPPQSGSWDGILLVLAGPNQADQWLCPSDGNLYHRIDDSNPVDGKSWNSWRRIYTSRNITISTSDPSGGSDGDIWFKVE